MENLTLKEKIDEKITDLWDWLSVSKYRFWGGGILILLIIVAAIYFTNLGTNLVNSLITHFKISRLQKENKKDAEKVSDLKDKASSAKSDVEELKKQDAVKQGEVNILRENYNSAQNNSDEAKQIASQAVSNANKIENTVYKDTPLTEAERKRCRAFPNSHGCR